MELTYNCLQFYADGHDPLGKLTALDRIATLHLLLGDYEKAETCLRQGIEIAQQMKSPRAQIVLFNNLGDVFLKTGRPAEEALPHFERSLELAQSDNYSYAIGLAALGCVECLIVLERDDEAEKMLDLARTNLEKAGRTRNLLNLDLNQAKLLYRKGRFGEAEKLALTILKKSETDDLLLVRYNAAVLLSELYEGNGMFKEALFLRSPQYRTVQEKGGNRYKKAVEWPGDALSE